MRGGYDRPDLARLRAITASQGIRRTPERHRCAHAKTTAGNCGAFVREEVQGEYAHFFLATYWASLPAIKNFAGKQYQVAVTYPEDEAFGLISDPYVFHHWVDEVTTL